MMLEYLVDQDDEFDWDLDVVMFVGYVGQLFVMLLLLVFGGVQFGVLKFDFDFDLLFMLGVVLFVFIVDEFVCIVCNKFDFVVEYVELGDLFGVCMLLQEVVDVNDVVMCDDVCVLFVKLVDEV